MGIIGLGSIAHKFASELLLEKEEVYCSLQKFR